LKPDFGEPTQVFDLFEGKNFELIITRQGEYNNYDKSKFSATRSSIVLDGQPAERTKENMTTIKAELDAAPSLDTYDYKVWDEETRNFVNGVLRMYLNPGDSIGEITSNSRASKPAAPKAKEAAGTATSNEDSFDVTEDMSSAPKNNVSSEDDLDAFLNDLDI
jgi:hypothetical protein